MKKGWKIFIKVLDAVVWLWGKIKEIIPKGDSGSTGSINNQKS